MYNVQIKCTYKDLDNGLNGSNDSEDFVDLAEDKYREEFLQVFGVEDYCDNTVNTIIQDLYKKMKDHEKMMTLLKKMATTFMSEDPEIGLMVGFSYTYFFLIHPCICDFLESGSISEENYFALKNEVENNIK